MPLIRLIYAGFLLVMPLSAQNRLDSAFLPRNSFAPGSRVKLLLRDPPSDLKVTLRPAMSPVLPCEIADRQDGSLIIILPVAAPPGSAEIVLESGAELRNLAIRLHAVRYIPQLRGDSASAVAQQDSPGGGALRSNALTMPAAPGDRVTLWGTGLGGRPLDGRLAVQLGAGQAVVPVQFTERLSDGRDRIEFRLPDSGIPIDCYVPLTLQVDRIPFFAGTIAISQERGGCPHRLGLQAPQLAALDRGGRVPVVYLSLDRTVRQYRDAAPAVNHSENALLWNAMANAADVENITGPMPAPVRNGCRIVSDDTRPLFAISGNPPPELETPLQLEGPGGASVEMTSQGGFFRWVREGVETNWTLIPAPVISEGRWKVQLPEEYTARSWEFNLPGPLALPGPPTLNLTAQGALTARWTVKDYGEADRVYLTFAPPGSDRFIACESSATEGVLVVPKQLIDDLAGDAIRASITVALAPAVNGTTFRLQRQDGAQAFGITRFSSSALVTESRPLSSF